MNPVLALFRLPHAWRCAFTNRNENPIDQLLAHASTDISRGQAILGIPFGGHADGDKIGASNAAIAEIMSELMKKTDRLSFGQWEFEDSPANPPMEWSYGVRGRMHITTREICEAFSERYPHLKRIIVVAHPDHMARCVATLHTLGIEAIVPLQYKQIPYDPSSRQLWCRGPWSKTSPWMNPYKFFVKRDIGFLQFEPVARLKFALEGWI